MFLYSRGYTCVCFWATGYATIDGGKFLPTTPVSQWVPRGTTHVNVVGSHVSMFRVHCSTPTGNCTWSWTMGRWRSPETHMRCMTLYLCFLKVLAMIRKLAQTKWQKMFLPHPHPPIQGISYLVSMGVLEDSSHSIAEFIHNTTALDWNSLRRFLQDRYAQQTVVYWGSLLTEIHWTTPGRMC